MFKNLSSPPPLENRSVYAIIWEYFGRTVQDTDENMIPSKRFACWITKTTDTYSEYVIIIVFPRQQLLRKRASMLRYTYIACRLLFMGPCIVIYFYSKTN